MADTVPKPLAFVAMPFRTRPTGLAAGEGPARVDFDALWDQAISPALQQLGYIPIRADNQAGSVIIKDMLEQLVYADLVLADISVDNANVYYEAGVRHGTNERGCVLIGADWAEPVFDFAQIRQVRYPLPGEALDDAAYLAIRQALIEGIGAMADARSPVHELTNYPDEAPGETASSFRAAAMALSEFQQSLRAVRLAADEPARAHLERLVADFQAAPRTPPAAAKELLGLVIDLQGWAAARAFIEALPAALREDAFFVEQLSLARSKLGDHAEAIAALEQLIKRFGSTPERHGLLAGRYKRLFAVESNARRRARYLDQAIEEYARGMDLDFNDYYCMSNLPRLLKLRNEADDHQRASFIGRLTVAACERARRLQLADAWLKPTLLGAAFDAEDTGKAAELCREISRDDPAAWQLESTLADLRTSTELINDESTRAGMEAIIAELSEMVWVSRATLEAALGEYVRNNGVRHQKTLAVRARSATPGECVITTTSSGRETENTAAAGDYLVENQTRARERYLVEKDKFEQRYRQVETMDEGWARYEPAAAAQVLAVAVDDAVLALLGKGSPFYIEAPWGSAQQVKRGDFLVAPVDLSEIYRIDAREFEESYSLA